jgi:hypothetical protein
MPKRKTPIGAVQNWLAVHKNYSGDDCLIWPFMRDKSGYGLVAAPYRQDRKRRKFFAHRIICEMAHGPMPFADAVAAHYVCENGSGGCVNPKHIRWSTAEQNYRDRIVFERIPRGEGNGHAKLTENQVKDIYARAHRGEQNKSLAAEYGIDRSQVSNIRYQKAWRHLW